MKDLRQLLVEAGYETIEEREERINKEIKAKEAKEKRIQQRRAEVDKIYEEQTGKKVFKGHQRNNTLTDIPADVPVKVTFLIDAVAKDKYVKNVKVVGAHNIQVEYNGQVYYIDHAWIRSDQVPSMKKIEKEHIGQAKTMTAKIKTYCRYDKVKYEFTTK